MAEHPQPVMYVQPQPMVVVQPMRGQADPCARKALIIWCSIDLALTLLSALIVVWSNSEAAKGGFPGFFAFLRTILGLSGAYHENLCQLLAYFWWGIINIIVSIVGIALLITYLGIDRQVVRKQVRRNFRRGYTEDDVEERMNLLYSLVVVSVVLLLIGIICVVIQSMLANRLINAIKQRMHFGPVVPMADV